MDIKYKKPVTPGADLLTQKEIALYLTQNPLVLLVVGAAWCPDTIRMVTKALPDIISNYFLATRFAIIYVEEAKKQVIAPEVGKLYGIERFPTLLLIRRNIVAERKISEGPLEEQINDVRHFLDIADSMT